MSLVILPKPVLTNFEGVSDEMLNMDADFATRGLSSPFCSLVAKPPALKPICLFSPLIVNLS